MTIPTPDSTWKWADPGHASLPLKLRLPPTLRGTLYSDSKDTAAFVVAPTDPAVEDVTLMLANESVQRPEDFRRVIVDGGGRIEGETREPASLAGRSAERVCGPIIQDLPAHFVGDTHFPAGPQADIYVAYYLPLGQRFVSVGYRIRKASAPQWQPIFEAVIATVRDTKR